MRYNIYGLFEQAVAVVLLLLLSSIIVVGLAHLSLAVKTDVFLSLDVPIEPEVYKISSARCLRCL
jgi:hypothetical protein